MSRPRSVSAGPDAAASDRQSALAYDDLPEEITGVTRRAVYFFRFLDARRGETVRFVSSKNRALARRLPSLEVPSLSLGPLGKLPS